MLDISFGLAENVEKERLTNVGSIRGWRFYFLSTSNYSLDELARRAGLEIDDAERGRLVDIPNPAAGHGIYENLHQFDDGEKFTDTLKVRCRKFCGVVGKAFVRKLVQDRAKKPNRLKKFLKRERTAYLKSINAKAQAAGLKPLNRASGRFATAFAAGSLAIEYGIFRWKRSDLLRAILACQVNGLRRSTVQRDRADTSIPGLRRKLVHYLKDNRGTFMKLPRLGTHKFRSAPGYIATFKGKKWLYLTAGQLTKIIGAGEHAAQLKKELVKNGLMAAGPQGKYVVQRPIFAAKGNKGHKWVHAFRAKILKEQD